jgi:hypothetical protein
MSARLARVIRRILRGGDKAGLARVAAITRPSEVELDARSERVLVAGNHMPAVGELAPWARVDEGMLVTCRNMRSLLPSLFAPAVGKQWQQVLVAADVPSTKLGVAHRDSSGRYWVKVGVQYYSQEADDFLTTNWIYRGQGMHSDVQCGATLADGDSIIELGREPFGIYARRVTIDPDTGGLTFGLLEGPLPASFMGQPLDASMCRDGDGYFHIASWSSYPYVTDPPKWQEHMWRSNAPDSLSSWTETFYALHDNPPENWRRPWLCVVNGAPVLFRMSSLQVDDVMYDDVVYRVWGGGAWGGTMDPGFDAYGYQFAAMGLPDGRLHIAYQDQARGLVWKQGRLNGGAIAWEAESVLLDFWYGATVGFQRNFEDDSASEVAWATSRYPDMSAGRLFRYGLPPGNEDEDIEDPENPILPIADTTRGIVAGGGHDDGDDPLDGFCAFRQGDDIYAARIVEES